MVVHHLHFLGFVIFLFITVILIFYFTSIVKLFYVNAGVLPFSDSSPHPTSWGDKGLQGHVESRN